MGWVDHENNNFRLKEDSLFRANRPTVENKFGSGSEGSDVGVQFEIYDRAQRAVSSVEVQAGANEATLRFAVASAENACSADVSADTAFAESKRFVEDAPVEGVHSIRLTGLKPGTRYNWRLLCGARAEGSLTTAAGSGGL
jgi:hypothetical protein